MDHAKAKIILGEMATRIDKLCELIDHGDNNFDIQIKDGYAAIKTDLEKYVVPLRTRSKFEKAPAVVQSFIFPALNEALLELYTPKGRNPSFEMALHLQSAHSQILHYYAQLDTA